MYVEGKLTHRKYQDKEGNDRYITEVVANIIRNLERREGDRNAPSATGDVPSDISTSPTVKKLDDFDEDDLPF